MSKNEMINITIDGNVLKVEKGITILTAARDNEIDIPTLCFLKGVNEQGSCRMCIVEVEGRRGFVTSCIAKVEEGMIINTSTKEILNSRKSTLDLIISNHHRDCLFCVRSGSCELQELSKKFNMKNIEYKGEMCIQEIDEKSPAIVRDSGKCILCKRCVSTCNNIQNIGAIDISGRGFNSKVDTSNDLSINDSNCTFCGQCIKACPTGALREKDNIDDVWDKINDPSITVIVQTAPAVRVALGEEFGMDIGSNVTGKMVTALKKIGFDKVFDTNTSADLTIMEEANEFLSRVQSNDNLPMITSCSPGWVKYIEMNYPKQLKHLSSCKSPHEMFGAILKSHYTKQEGIDPEKTCVVSIMPCVAKKFEANRKELSSNGQRDVDIVLTTRELARMIKEANIEFITLEDGLFDSPMGEATGAGAIFGTTGGVMEAAIRTAADKLIGEDLKEIEYKVIRGEKGIKRATLNLAGKEINVVVASGLSNAKIILDEIESGKANYHFVEIMACPGGCIMGGGQPIKSSKIQDTVDVAKLRRDAIYTIDEKSKVRKSHESPYMKKLYDEFLEKPGSHIAHELLHTTYEERSKYNIEGE